MRRGGEKTSFQPCLLMCYYTHNTLPIFSLSWQKLCHAASFEWCLALQGAKSWKLCCSNGSQKDFCLTGSAVAFQGGWSGWSQGEWAIIYWVKINLFPNCWWVWIDAFLSVFVFAIHCSREILLRYLKVRRTTALSISRHPINCSCNTDRTFF